MNARFVAELAPKGRPASFPKTVSLEKDSCLTLLLASPMNRFSLLSIFPDGQKKLSTRPPIHDEWDSDPISLVGLKVREFEISPCHRFCYE